MKKIGISQEILKMIACVTMLLDHIGAALIYDMYVDAGMVNGVDMLGAAAPDRAQARYRIYLLLRIIGRLAFPIYCFLLAEGIAHTRNPKKYGLRLMLGALLAEIPFDLLFFGELTFAHQSVMVTLLLGFLMAMWAKKCGNILLPFAVCFFAAELLGTDYGGIGVALIGLFVVSDQRPNKLLIQLVGMIVLMLLMGSVEVSVGIVNVPIQMFAVLSMIPIYFYSGRKITSSTWVQVVFYLFYPVHLFLLLLIVQA